MWHRKPAFAGSFYPSNPQQLTKDIQHYLKSAEKKKLPGELVSLVVPHAGYIYSGPVAAYSFIHLIDSGVEVAIVLAPSHRVRFEGASVIPSGIYETPLGKVAIDESLGISLEKLKHIDFIKQVHDAEHSLEVQVPFLQVALGDFALVPLIVGTTDSGTCETLAAEIAGVLSNDKRKKVIIISTDLSHYHSYDSARSLDRVFIEKLAQFDVPALYSALCDDETQACGEGPVFTGMYLSRNMGARKVEILKYANSGDTAGGKDQVVGYLSAAMCM